MNARYGLLVKMKTLILALLLVACVADGPYENFTRGFLEGVGEHKDPLQIYGCVKDFNNSIIAINTGLKRVKEMKLGRVLEGLNQMIRANKDIHTFLSPCSSGYDTYNKFIAAVGTAEVRKLAAKVMGNPQQYSHDINSALDCFAKNDLYCAAKYTATFERILIVPQITDVNDVIKFLKGFFEGIGEKGDVNKLLECINDVEKVFKKLLEALEHIKKMTIVEVIQGVMILIEAVKEFMGYIKPCTEGLEVINKLIAAVANADIQKIAMNILMHSSEILKDVTSAISCFTSADYNCAGVAIGHLLKLIFLS